MVLCQEQALPYVRKRIKGFKITSGVQGTGLYSRKRELENMLRADTQHLENAPLTLRKRMALVKRITETAKELKEIRQKIREQKPT